MIRQAILTFGLVALASHLNAVSAFTVDASRPAGKVSPMLYGLMTEEINHAYDFVLRFASYYTIQLFSRNVGDEILAVSSEESVIQGCATRDSRTGEIFIKLVNPGMTSAVVKIEIKGVTALASQGTVTTLQGSPEDLNSISHPRNVLPVVTTVRDVKAEFPYTMRPQSIVLLKLMSR
jgi:Alpha-L-arabinofuranosidase C-terminal domain